MEFYYKKIRYLQGYDGRVKKFATTITTAFVKGNIYRAKKDNAKTKHEHIPHNFYNYTIFDDIIGKPVASVNPLASRI